MVLAAAMTQLDPADYVVLTLAAVMIVIFVWLAIGDGGEK